MPQKPQRFRVKCPVVLILDGVRVRQSGKPSATCLLAVLPTTWACGVAFALCYCCYHVSVGHGVGRGSLVCGMCALLSAQLPQLSLVPVASARHFVFGGQGLRGNDSHTAWRGSSAAGKSMRRRTVGRHSCRVRPAIPACGCKDFLHAANLQMACAHV